MQAGAYGGTLQISMELHGPDALMRLMGRTRRETLQRNRLRRIRPAAAVLILCSVAPWSSPYRQQRLRQQSAISWRSLAPISFIFKFQLSSCMTVTPKRRPLGLRELAALGHFHPLNPNQPQNKNPLNLLSTT